MLTTLILAGCLNAPLTDSDADNALDETLASAKADAVIAPIVEITTDVTLGERADQAAQDRMDWFQSQIPCSTVTRDGRTVTVDFGTLDDQCAYEGHTYAGVLRLTYDFADSHRGVVEHAWAGFTDGDFILDGTTTVDWTNAATPRHVVSNLRWLQARVTTDTTSELWIDRLDPQVDGPGVQLDGERDWHNVVGDRHLAIDGIQMRGMDPIPQAGMYTLTTFDDRTITMRFERVDADTIRVFVTEDGYLKVIDVTSTQKPGITPGLEPGYSPADDGDVYSQ